MAGTAPDNRLHVVVGVIRDISERVFIQQRRPGTPRAGQWEFPGGKLEIGESGQQALARELHEELGIIVTGTRHLANITHDYEHARVWLDTFLVTAYDGQPEGCEGQAIAWTSLADIFRFDVLEAVYPIVDALQKEPVQ